MVDQGQTGSGLLDVRIVKFLSSVMLSVFGASNAIAAPGDGPSQPRFDVSVTARDSYDSNVLRGSAIRQSRPNASKDDLVFSPSITGNLIAPIGRNDVFLRGSVGYQFHRRNSYLDRESIGVTGGTTLRMLGGCDTTISGDHQRRQSELTDFVDGLDPQNTAKTTTASIGFECETRAGIRSSLSYRRSLSESSSPIRVSSNYTLDGIDASVGFTRPAIGTVSVFGNYSGVDYTNRISPIGGGITDGVKIYSGGLRFQRDIGARLKGGGSIGYSYVNQSIPGVPSFKGANYGLDLSYDSRNRLRLALGINRSVQQSNQLGVSYSVTRRANFDANYIISSSFRLAAGVFQQRRTSARTTVGPFLGQFNTNDKIFGSYARLEFRGSGPISLGAEVAHDRRRSNIAVFDYNSTRVAVTATYRLSGAGF
jgi:Putative beta-barrel porin 2